MRLLPFVLAAAVFATACGDGKGAPADAPIGDDDAAPLPDAALPDAELADAPLPDAPPHIDGIAAARAATDGDGLTLAISDVTVTYLKPQIGSLTNDPAGFTIQASKLGPALFVAVDPATLTPAAQVGDVVSFTITSKKTVGLQPRATVISDYTRSATGADVAALAQDITAATDVVTALDSYDSELVSVTGTLTQTPVSAGTGFQRSTISTTGIASDPNFQLRVPQAVITAIDMVQTCQVTVTNVPMGRFAAQAQIGAFSAAELSLQGCPAPAVTAATATSTTGLRLTFTRNILPSSVLADGSQFTFDHGLTASAAVVAGRTITLTTSAQTLATTYVATVAASVTDLQGSAVATPGTASFLAFNPNLGPGAQLSVHTTMGIPSPSSTSTPDSFLSVKPEYVLSYNGSRKVPNWVSWELNSSYLGSSGRGSNFRPDDTFPASEPQAALTDYSGSGYDRGHMCPSADRTLSAPINEQTFYLTNMVPQAANNNQGPWADLENDSRALVGTGKELFIISGGTFSATSNTIGAGAVMVPDKTFKVIVVLNAVGEGTAAVTTTTRVIAVLMPNENTEISRTADWHDFRVSVDSIETLTGYDFLSDVPTEIQAVIEASVDTQ